MKKILTILAAAAAIFGAASCSTGTMHDAEVMLVDKVVVDGLTNLVGQEMVISGNWILGKDGTSTWVHGLGDSSKIAAGAIGTVGADGSVEFKINQLTSEATLEFLGKVNEDGWVSSKRFGEKAYAEGNAKVPNAYTGSATPKTILGRVQDDKTITWTIVDVIPPAPIPSMAIGSIMVNGLPATMNGRSVELQGFWGNGTAATAPAATVANGSLTITFATPSIQDGETLEFKLKPIDADGGWDWSIGGACRLGSATDVPNASITNSRTGSVDIQSIVGTVNADNTVTWTVGEPVYTNMAIGKITLANLPASMNGKTVEFMGFWGDGAAATAPNAVVTNGIVTLTFADPSVQSGENLEFKIKPIAADGDWDWAVGNACRLGGADVGNAAITNTKTGPSVVKTIGGIVNADNTVTWFVSN